MAATTANDAVENVPLEHACGHIVRLNLWADEARRKRQLARLEAAPCDRCLAAGWKAPAAGGPKK